VSVPDAHIAAELGAMRTQVGVPQLFHADKTPKHLKEINYFRKLFLVLVLTENSYGYKRSVPLLDSPWLVLLSWAAVQQIPLSRRKQK
jgi:hypothetical protein